MELTNKLGIQPELRRALTELGAVAIPVGLPVNAVASVLSTNLAGGDNDLDYTAKTMGVSGDSITISYIDPAVINAVLAVTAIGTDIRVSLATDGAGAITTIASEIKAAIEAVPVAHALVGIANKAGNNGTGIVIALAETPLAGGVDGTPAVVGAVALSGVRIYTCPAGNTISGANWLVTPADSVTF